MVDAINFVGTASDACDYVASYLEAGAQEAIINPLPWGADQLQTIDDTLTALCDVRAKATEAAL